MHFVKYCGWPVGNSDTFTAPWVLLGDVQLQNAGLLFKQTLIVECGSVGGAHGFLVRRAGIPTDTAGVKRTERLAKREIVARDVDAGVQIWEEGTESQNREVVRLH